MTFSNDSNINSYNNNSEIEQEEIQQGNEYLKDMEEVKKEIGLMQDTLEKKITFKANNKEYKFELDDDGKPIELGSGNYGVVYLVYCEETKLYYAFKIIFKAELSVKNKLLEAANNYDVSDAIASTTEQGSNTNTEIIKNIIHNFVNNFIENYDGDDLSKEEYYREMQGFQLILYRLNQEYESEKKLGVNFQIPNLVMAEDSITNFRESSAYTEYLAKEFSNNIFSDYGLISEKYDGTLQDLLQNGIKKYAIEPDNNGDEYSRYDNIYYSIEEAQKELNGTNNQSKSGELETSESGEQTPEEAQKELEINNCDPRIYELNGLDILTMMEFERRKYTILPILEMVINGLVRVHKAGLLHLDIKPANVLYLRDDFAANKSFKCALTDFGNLPGKSFNPKNLLGKFDRLALGTLHFRSPEQKYYSDTAFVLVKKGENNNIELIIHDVIFKDTIMEIGDYVVFSKYKDIPFDIEEIDLGQYRKSPVIVTIKDPKNLLKNEKSLQANFYKMPTVRTDLFGIGGLFFYLITCGESPERFYEAIRSFDVKDSHVDTILDKYKGVKNVDFGDPDLVRIFEPFKDRRNNDFLDSEIVELILKCMLYNSAGTFYQETLKNVKHKSEIKAQATESLQKEFSQL